jgi:hypothetical protein
MGRRGQHGPSVDFEENETERERREDIDVVSSPRIFGHY